MHAKANRCNLPRAGILPALALLLVACSDTQPLNGLQFARVWQDSYADAAISWWYLGEDGEHFYLEEKWPDKAMVVKLRYFAGMTIPEASQALKISTATAERHWRFARAWLRSQLDQKT